jgi:hypothetical protein
MFNNWNYLYKTNYSGSGTLSTTNMLYTPYVSPDGKTLLMRFDENSEYQKNNRQLNPELVTYFFNRELDNIKRFQGHDWCPELFDYDVGKQLIYIEFNHETVNYIVADSERDLDKELPDWKQQIEKMIVELYELQYYKMSLYPHCYFISEDKKLKSIDYYGGFKVGDTISREFISGIIGANSLDRFDFATVNGNIDCDKFFEYTLKYQLDSMWKDKNPFPELYEKIINAKL